MENSFEIRGAWYLPDKPDDELTGVLNYTANESIILDLIGTFDKFPNDERDVTTILGFTTTGKEVTLFNCSRARFTMNMPGLYTCKYRATYLIIGLKTTDFPQFKFYKIRVRLKNLEEWINLKKFMPEYNKNDYSFKLECSIPATIKFRINSSYYGEIETSYLSSWKSNSLFQIEYVNTINIITDEEVTFHELLKEIHHFKKFLSFIIFQDTYYREIKVFSKSQFTEYGKNERFDKAIEVYFIEEGLRQEKTVSDFVLNYNEIAENFEDVILRWFDMCQQNSPVINNLCSTFSNRTIFTEDYFLNVVQALEIYHRRNIEDRVDLKKKFENEIVEMFPSICDEQYNWIQDKMRYGYEPNLRKKLKELFEKYYVFPITKFARNNEGIKQIINSAVCSRNYYTHYDESNNKNVLKGRELYFLSQKLRVLLLVIILKEFGFEDSKIEVVFKRINPLYFSYLYE